MLKERRRRTKILKHARQMSLPKRAQLFRILLYGNGGGGDQRLLRELAEMSRGADPSMARYADALSQGHRVKVGTYRVTFLTFEGMPADLVYEIEDAFNKDDTNLIDALDAVADAINDEGEAE